MTFVGIEEPPLCKFSFLPVPCTDGKPAIIPPAHHKTGMHSIEICNACEESVDTVTIAFIVSPGTLITSTRHVINSFHSFPCLTIKDSKEFWTVYNFSFFIYIICRRISYYLSFTINCCLLYT